MKIILFSLLTFFSVSCQKEENEKNNSLVYQGLLKNCEGTDPLRMESCMGLSVNNLVSLSSKSSSVPLALRTVKDKCDRKPAEMGCYTIFVRSLLLLSQSENNK